MKLSRFSLTIAVGFAPPLQFFLLNIPPHLTRFATLRSGILIRDYHVLKTSGRNFNKLRLMIQFWRLMNWLGFNGRGIKGKVTARSNIWVSYSCGWRHRHRRVGVEISSNLALFWCSCKTTTFSMFLCRIKPLKVSFQDKDAAEKKRGFAGEFFGSCYGLRRDSYSYLGRQMTVGGNGRKRLQRGPQSRLRRVIYFDVEQAETRIFN